MRFTSKPIVLALAGFLAQGAVAADFVVSVDGARLPDELVSQALTSGGGPLTPAQAQAALSNLIQQEILVRLARDKKMDQTPAIQMAIEIFTRQQLAQAALQDYLNKHPIAEKALRARYDQLKDSLPEEEYRARHILLKTREEAMQVIDALKAGEPFGNLASRSLDTQTAGKGGELGWQNAQTILPALMMPLRELDPGQVAGPIDTPQGFDVIQFLEKRPTQAIPFEQAKAQIETQLRNELAQKYLTELALKAKIAVDAKPK